MNLNFDESKIVRILLECDEQNLIEITMNKGNVTGTKIVSRNVLKPAPLTQAEIDRKLINKSADIAKSIDDLRKKMGTPPDFFTDSSIKEEFVKTNDIINKSMAVKDAYIDKALENNSKKSKEIMDTLDQIDSKSFVTEQAVNALNEIKEEDEKDYEEDWIKATEGKEAKKEEAKPEPDVKVDKKVSITEKINAVKQPKKKEFQDGVTEKEQQLLDIIAKTQIDKLPTNENFLKKIGEYKNLAKSKMTKFEASKKIGKRYNKLNELK